MSRIFHMDFFLILTYMLMKYIKTFYIYYLENYIFFVINLIFLKKCNNNKKLL